MKKLLLYSAIAVASLSACSEDFLTIEPAGSVGQATLANYNGVEMVAAGAYSLLYNGSHNGSLSNMVWGDCIGGDAQKGSDPSDQADWGNIDAYSFQSNNGYILSNWRRRYEGVHRSNELLYIAELAQDKLAGKLIDGVDYYTDIQAEARFLKAIHYFDLVKVFGAAVPYITLDAYKSATDPKVSNVDENGNYIYIWNNIIEDLKYAYDNLPAKRADGNKGRATKYAAAGYLGKVYLYMSSPYNGTNGTKANGYVAEAKKYLLDVIENGVNAQDKKYELAPVFAMLWDNDTYDSDWGHSESLFDIQQLVSGTQTSTNALYASYYPAFAGAIKGSGWGFYTPTSDLAHSFMVDKDGLPLSNYRELTVKKENKMSNLDPDNDKVIKTDLTIVTDPRIDVTMGRFDVPFYTWGTPSEHAKWVRNLSNCGPFLSKKNIETSTSDGVSTVSGTSAKNFHLMRLAEVYLNYAECCILDNDLKTARYYINLVRERAGKSALKTPGSSYTLTVDGQVVETGTSGMYAVSQYKKDFASVEEAWTALKRERRAELGMEGQHWFDLCRWGNVGQDLTDFVTYEAQGFAPGKYASSYNNKWICMPMPFQELNTMQGLLVQNENWKE